MLAKYCQYCGSDLNDRCNCEIEIERERAEMIEDYENSPEYLAGCVFEDRIYNWRMER